MIAWLQHFLDGINSLPVWYVSAFFALSGMLQALVPVFPGDILLIIGAGVWTGGLTNDFLPVLFSYWTGTTAASLALTEIGRHFGARLLSHKALRRFFPEERQVRAAKWVARRGALTIFAAKFIFGMNLPVLLLSGILNMPRKKVYPAVLITTVVHNGLLYTLGSVVGLNWQSVNAFLREYEMIVAIVLALLLALGFYLRRRVSGRK